MAIQARVSIAKQVRETIRTVNVGATPSKLSSLTDVDVSTQSDNDVLTYDQARNKYVVKPVTAPAITNLDGGSF